MAGDLKLEGEPEAEVVVGPARDTLGIWGAVEVLDGGELKATHARIDGIGSLRSEPGSSLRLEDCVWDAGEFSEAFELDGQEVRLERTEIRNSYGLHLAAGSIEGGSIRSGFKQQGPLLLLGEDAESCRDLEILDALEGVQVAGGDVSLRGVTIRMSESSARPERGIEVVRGGHLTADDIAVVGYPTGIEIRGQGCIVLRNSTIERFATGVFIHGGADFVDLGNGTFGIDSWGRNDFFPIPGADSRGVVNRGGLGCLAQWNYWGSAAPSPSLFEGTVAWEPHGVVPYEAVALPEERIVEAPAGGPVEGQGRVSFEAAWPNPFNPTVRFRFRVDGPPRVLTLTIHDVLGRRQALVFDERFEPGIHEWSWEARNDEGRQLGSGVYFARFQESDESLKLLLLK